MSALGKLMPNLSYAKGRVSYAIPIDVMSEA